MGNFKIEVLEQIKKSDGYYFRIKSSFNGEEIIKDYKATGKFKKYINLKD